MRDDEVGEVRRLLDRAQRLGGTLEAAGQVHEGAHDEELGRQVAAEGVPAPDHGAEEVLQHGPHRHDQQRSEEHTSELQSLMRISYAVFCLKKKKQKNKTEYNNKNSDTEQCQTISY